MFKMSLHSDREPDTGANLSYHVYGYSEKFLRLNCSANLDILVKRLMLVSSNLLIWQHQSLSN